MITRLLPPIKWMIMGPLVLICHCIPKGMVAIRPSGIVIHNVMAQKSLSGSDQVSQPKLGLVIY